MIGDDNHLKRGMPLSGSQPGLGYVGSRAPRSEPQQTDSVDLGQTPIQGSKEDGYLEHPSKPAKPDQGKTRTQLTFKWEMTDDGLRMKAVPTTITMEDPVPAPDQSSGETQELEAPKAQTLAELSKQVAASVDAEKAAAAKAQADPVGKARQAAAQKVDEIKEAGAAKTTGTGLDPAPTTGQKIGWARRLGRALLRFVSGDPLKQFHAESEKINELESWAKTFKTPEQFKAQTAEFKKRLQAGESLEDLRPEAYALAREAARQVTGMRHYDCQVIGALAMDDGNIAEMRTGEGKTLTAVMPLYLNALAGKGAHLVTVNETLAARDREEMGPVFEHLGLSVGLVTEKMSLPDKKAGYAADVTYTTDRALGFDFLRDRTAKHPDNRVQREPYFALIDEVDEVLIDEARTPLIISGQGQEENEEFKLFNRVATTLVAGDDYYTDPKQNTVWLSETGTAWVETELARLEIDQRLSTNPQPSEKAELLAERKKLDAFGQQIRKEQKALDEFHQMKKKKPGFFKKLIGKGDGEFDADKLEKLEKAWKDEEAKRLEMAKDTPTYPLYAEENSHRVRFMQACLKAHAMFEAGKDYLAVPSPEEVKAQEIAKQTGVPISKADMERFTEMRTIQIVDENKGRTSDGKRYNDGLHEAIEAKEGAKINPENRTIASITYPNFFKKYQRLSGMSGTAKTSAGEFHELYKLNVVEVPTNLWFQTRNDPGGPIMTRLIQEPDRVFLTLKEKYQQQAERAARDFEEGIPVLIGTLSVEHNQYMAQELARAGVPWNGIQVLNAQSARGDKQKEMEIIANAGKSGVVTVATNMAGRGQDIKAELTNFKKLSIQVANAALDENKPVIVHCKDKKEGDRLAEWLAAVPLLVTDEPIEDVPGPGQVLIRCGHQGEVPKDAQLFEAKDYPTGGLTVLLSERANSRRVDLQFMGRSARQGAPGRAAFYLSLEDDLLRIFGGKAFEPLMGLFGDTSQGVSSPLIDKAIAKAQQNVEMQHFSIRENTNKQDETLNMQREAFFGLRNDVLTAGTPKSDMDLVGTATEYVGDAIENAVDLALRKQRYRDVDPEIAEAKGLDFDAPKKVSVDDMKDALGVASEMLSLPLDYDFGDKKKVKTEDVVKVLRENAEDLFDRTIKGLERNGGNIQAGLKIEMLRVMDECWSIHLDDMENLKRGIHWVSLAQQDPEVMFKLRGADQFDNTIKEIKHKTASEVFKLMRIIKEQGDLVRQKAAETPQTPTAA